MKCLIINHENKQIDKLKNFFLDMDPQVVHHADFKRELADDYDFVVLSGGPMHVSSPEDLVEEKKFIMTTKKPILGVCLGLQIICVTYGSKLLELESKREGKHSIEFLGLKGKISHIHGWYVHDVPEEFEVLSRTGKIVEVIRHKTRPILALQGHPEISGEFGQKIRTLFIENFVKKPL